MGSKMAAPCYGVCAMVHSSIKAGIVLTFAAFVVAGQAFATSPLRLQNIAPVVVPIQDEENKELWQDLRPDVTPPEAAVGNEGEAARRWEQATNKIDCEKAAGIQQVLGEKIERWFVDTWGARF